MSSIFSDLVNLATDEPVKEVSIYQNTVYLENSNVGLASTEVVTIECGSITNAGHIHEENTNAIAKRLLSHNVPDRPLGLAAVNSSVNEMSKIKGRTSEINAFDIVKEKGENKNISVIGSFPNVKKLKENLKYKNLWVFELNPTSEEHLSPRYFEEYLPQSYVVLITATSLINYTFIEIHRYLKNSYNIMLGPSTPLHPIMFDYKIDALAGAIITDRQKAKMFFSQAAPFRKAEGVIRLTYFKD